MNDGFRPRSSQRCDKRSHENTPSAWPTIEYPVGLADKKLSVGLADKKLPVGLADKGAKNQMLKSLLSIAALTAAATVAAPAVASASPAQVTANVNLRAGPGTQYYPIVVLPAAVV